jgi:hypothetical protein
MELNPLDILVLLKIVAQKPLPWTQTSLAKDLHIAQSQVHSSLRRAEAARLYSSTTKRVSHSALLEFIVHGVKYAYPPKRAGLTRGIPTGYAAEPLRDYIAQPADPPPVWPDPEGSVRGYEFEPIDKRAPRAAQTDPNLYRLLVLVDAIRDGSARESKIAIDLLRKELNQHS